MRGWRAILLLCAFLWGSVDVFALRYAPCELSLQSGCTRVLDKGVSRARYYQPALGRFWTMDTYEGSKGDPLSLHKYLYCGADPINHTDLSGCAMDVDKACRAEYDQAIAYLKKSKTATDFINSLIEDKAHAYVVRATKRG